MTSPAITLTPEEFTLTRFDAAALLDIARDVAATVALPDGVAVRIEVDEVLGTPLTASAVDVGDGAVNLWFTGGCFESGRHQAQLDPDVTRAELGAAFLRAQDRLGGGFADAPADDELSERERAMWDVYAEGRLARLGGFTVREARRRYAFRLYCGFNDEADAIFARLWNGRDLTWADVAAWRVELDVLAPAAPAKRAPLRRESLRSR